MKTIYIYLKNNYLSSDLNIENFHYIKETEEIVINEVIEVSFQDSRLRVLYKNPSRSEPFLRFFNLNDIILFTCN